jgi:hypothetical protein
MLRGLRSVRQGVHGRSAFQLGPASVARRLSWFLPAKLLPWYIGTNMRTVRYQKKFVVERVQTGVRMEKRLLKVLKALAEFHDLTLGDLLEGIVLHAFDGKTPFQRASRQRIKQLKRFYGLDLDARASHRLTEAREVSRARGPRADLRNRAKRGEPAKPTRAHSKDGRRGQPVRSAARHQSKKGGRSR